MKLIRSRFAVIPAMIFFIILSGCSNKMKSVTDEAEAIPVSVNRYWKDTDKSANPTLGCPGRVMPLSYRMLDTDYAGLRKLLLRERTQPVNLDTIILSFPLPEGGWEDFSMTQVQVMPPELAEKYPEIRTYSGTSKVFPADNIRLDIAPKGITAMILSTRGTIMMDPFCGFDTTHVISYYKKHLPGDMKLPFEK